MMISVQKSVSWTFLIIICSSWWLTSYAFLYLGDLLAYSAGSSGYTEVVPVRSAHGGAAVCGVLAVRLDGLDIVRRCLLLASSQRDLSQWAAL